MVTTTYGRSTGFCVDPIEKKPLNHFYPGTSVLSFGTAGCNLGCKFCQNWSTSKSRDVEAACEAAAPEAIAEAAVRLGCRSVAFTYNDPIVWAEYAIDTACACRQAGVKTVAVTSGYINAEAREAFFQHIDAANVDLKGFSDDFYRTLTGGRLEPVLDTLRWLARHSNTWLEITNLIIPAGERFARRRSSGCAAGSSRNWGPTCRCTSRRFIPTSSCPIAGPTPPETLAAAYDIARRCGLRYVYTGNVSDRRRQTTYCPGCGQAGDRARRLSSWASIASARAAARSATRRLPAGSTTGRAIGAAAACRSASATSCPEPPVPADRPAGCAPSLTRGATAAGLPGGGPSAWRPPCESRPARPMPAAPGRHRRHCPSMAASSASNAAGNSAPVAVSSGLGVAGRGGQPCRRPRRPATIRASRPSRPTELDSLDMEVWLLWGLQPVAARGRDRLQAVTIGKHGVQIARGQARGLLLPCVAVDHHLDAKGLLQQVCLKAGLPADAWLRRRHHADDLRGLCHRRPLREATGRRRKPSRKADCADGGEEDPRRRGPSPEAAEDRPAAVAGAFYPAPARGDRPHAR